MSLTIPAMRPAGPTHLEGAGGERGSLADTDPARELAQLTALRDRQSLGPASPSPTSRAPRTLLSLFGHA